MGKKKNFAGATAPPSHYVAPPLDVVISYLQKTREKVSEVP